MGMLTLDRYGPLSMVLPHRNYLTAQYFTVLSSIYPVIFVLIFYQLYPVSVGSVHIKLGENNEDELDFTSGFLDE